MSISVKNELHYSAVLVKRILIILFIYSMGRLYFFIANKSIIPEFDFQSFLYCSFYGIRFDLCAIAYTNALFIFLHAIPFSFRDRKFYQAICKVLFYLVNGIALLVMIGDAEYYRFSLRHGTIELWDFMKDFIPLIPAYLVDFWYFIPIVILIFIITEFLYRRTKRTSAGVSKKSYGAFLAGKRNFFIQLVLFMVIGGLTFLAMRGGLQKYPISPVVAGRYVAPPLVPLVINTPFNIISSITHKEVEPIHYFDEKELAENFTYLKQPASDTAMPYYKGTRDNIVIIIMESFSAEYTFLDGPEKSATPFLDSLAQQSMYFTSMYSNGTRSIDGMPAILARIPANMPESFLFSIYQANYYKGLPAHLKELGYSSAYFHGGHNGTFNLDNFSYTAGFEKYYGMNEYHGKNEDESHWGIYDEPFFLFTANKISQMDTPFVASFFSLSSHHPYTVPANYVKTHSQNKNEVLNAIQYADYSLGVFFEKIKTQKWFKNTLFIITADHCGPHVGKKAHLRINRMRVPLILYHPTDTFFKGKNTQVTQQIDIHPTILDFLKYPKGYKSFGTGIYRKGEHFANLYLAGYEYITDGKYVLEIFDEKVTGLFELKNNLAFDENILGSNPDLKNKLENKSKAFKQTYINALIENKMCE